MPGFSVPKSYGRLVNVYYQGGPQFMFEDSNGTVRMVSNLGETYAEITRT
jgi:hypothetical protein